MKTEAFAFVYKVRRGWTYTTDDDGTVTLGPIFPSQREAFDAAHRAAFLLRFRPIQERINATIRTLASVYPVQHLVIDPAKWQAATRPPEPKVWEGDYA